MSTGLLPASPDSERAVPSSGRTPYAALFVCLVAVTVAVSIKVSAPSIGVALGASIGVGVTIWMFFSEQLERPLIVLLLYLGLLDGFLKLRTNSSAVTLGRDVLLYAICLGWLSRSVLRRQRLVLPPLSGWPLAFVAVVLAQLANPADAGRLHTLGALRPHLEFVPLFFIGYGMLQTRNRLRVFFVTMLVIATANGIVGAIQLNLTPAQLASWGPGYAYRINGNGAGVNQVSARTFHTASGTARTRPFGLGDDAGIGEAWGMLALGGALALISLGARTRAGRLSLLLCIGPPLAVISGEGRALLIGSVVALFVYILMATTARRIIPTLLSVLVGLIAIAAVVAYVSSVSGSGVFSRYATVTPGKLTSTTGADRGDSFAAIPTLFVQHPLGNGLGSVGPASGYAGGDQNGSNGETEPGFLLSELGIPGLIVVYGFNLTLLVLGVSRIRRLDPELRAYLAAILAGLVGLLIVGVSSATTSISPLSPYLWFSGGVLSYWLVGQRRGISTQVTLNN